MRECGHSSAVDVVHESAELWVRLTCDGERFVKRIRLGSKLNKQMFFLSLIVLIVQTKIRRHTSGRRKTKRRQIRPSVSYPLQCKAIYRCLEVETLCL